MELSNIVSSKTNKNAKYLPLEISVPKISPKACIRRSFIQGDVTIEDNVHVVNAAIRADEGSPFFISKGVNIQDFVTLHGYTTTNNGEPNYQNMVHVEGKGHFSIFVDEDSSLSHGVLIHGPCFIGKNSFIGFKSTVEKSWIGNNVEIGAHSYIANIKIPDNVGIKPNSVILSQDELEQFIIKPKNINKTISAVNKELCERYRNQKEEG